MQNAVAYKQIADALGITVNKMETELGLSNGSLRKAIERKSAIKSDVIEKIVSNYPKISRIWLATGEGEMFISARRKAQLEDPPPQPADWKDKYITALERAAEDRRLIIDNQGRLEDSHTAIMHLVQRVDVIAETSTKAADLAQKAVEGVNNLAGVLQNLKGNIESAGDVPAALQVWLGENLGKFLGRDSIVIAGEIGELANEARKLREHHTAPDSNRGITRGKARTPA